MKATLIDHLGDDLRVVNAARVSFDKESQLERQYFEEEDKAERYAEETLGQIDWDHVYSDRWFGGYNVSHLSTQDNRLIRYLASHGHFTPFTHPQITLREDVPIFVARQRFKHVVGFTYNEVSRRYVDAEPEFYEPEVWRKRPDGSVKQGSSDEPVFANKACRRDYEMFIKYAEELYREFLVDGVCPEQARMVLPQSMMTSYYVTGSLAAFARAYKQRSDAHAQLEIQMLAKEWDRLIRPLYPVSWSALVDPSGAH